MSRTGEGAGEEAGKVVSGDRLGLQRGGTVGQATSLCPRLLCVPIPLGCGVARLLISWKWKVTWTLREGWLPGCPQLWGAVERGGPSQRALCPSAFLGGPCLPYSGVDTLWKRVLPLPVALPRSLLPSLPFHACTQIVPTSQ